MSIATYGKDNNPLVEVYDETGKKQAALLVASAPGSLNTGAGASLTAFGEQAVAEYRYHAGWSFGYQINPNAVRQTTLNGGSVSQSNSAAVIQTGTAVDGVAFIRTNAHVVYNPGIGVRVIFTAMFDTPQPNSLQLIGLGDFKDGWFFGYLGTQFGVLRRKGGVDEWVFQDAWNRDKFDSLNPQNINVYEIKVQWLGGGDQTFNIKKPSGGGIEKAHVIEYANEYDSVSVEIPNLPISAGVANLGNTTNISLKTPSASGGSQGEAYPDALTVLVGFDTKKTIASGTNYLFSIQAPASWLGKDNRLYGEPELLSITSAGTKEVTIRVLFGSILTAPSWVDLETNISHLQSDVAASAFTNGVEVATLTLAKDDSKDIDIKAFLGAAKVWPDSSVTFIAESTAASDITIGMTWRSRI